VLGHFVLVDHTAHAHPDLIGPAQALARDHRAHFLKLSGRGLQQRLALMGAQLGKLRIAAGDQALARELRMRQFKQIALIKQAQLHRPIFEHRTNLCALERGDPVQGLRLAQLLDRLLRDHPPIARDHYRVDAKLAAQALGLRQERLAIGGVAREHRDRDRTPARVGEQPIIHLQLVLLAVAVVADSAKRAAHALEVARGQIVEHQAPGAQVARGELLLDGALAFEQPVHRLI